MNRCILLSLLLQKVAWLKFRVWKDQYGLEYLGEAIEREETGLNPKEKLCTGRWLPRYLLCPLVPGRNSPFETPGLWLNQVADSPWSGGKHSANGRRPEMSCCCQSSLACQVSDASFTMQRRWILCHHSHQPHFEKPTSFIIPRVFSRSGYFLST